MTFNCFVCRRICCIAVFFPFQISLDFLWIPCDAFCFFPSFFGWVLLSWITAGTTPAAHLVFMATCLLLRTLGIFWDPLSKALTSCHRRISLLQLISFSTSRHTNSQTICYKTVACSSAARSPSPAQEDATELKEAFVLFWFTFFFLFLFWGFFWFSCCCCLMLKAVQKACDTPSSLLTKGPSCSHHARPVQGTREGLHHPHTAVRQSLPDVFLWGFPFFPPSWALVLATQNTCLIPIEQSQKRNLKCFSHPKIKCSISHHWILRFNLSPSTDTLPKPCRSETSLQLSLIMVSLLLYHVKSPLYWHKLNPTTRNLLPLL